MSFFKYVVFMVSVFLSTVALAKDLQIVIGDELPPYVFKQMNAGIEVDIIKEALKVRGHRVSFQFVHYLHLQTRLNTRELDGIAQNTIFDIGKEANIRLYESDTTIKYHNFAITFLDQINKIDSINDLVNKKILAFQNASRYLGPVYAEMADNNEGYREYPQQSFQVKQLYAGKIDVVISEKRIFNYWRSQAESKGSLESKDIKKKLKFHNIFEASPRNVKFLDSSIRDDFNYGLKYIKASGLYQGIINKYENM